MKDLKKILSNITLGIVIAVVVVTTVYMYALHIMYLIHTIISWFN